MIKKFNIPIRFKIMLAVLIIITVVVSIITFTMANMFHTDKTAYIQDTTSTIAVHKSQEVASLLKGYKERLHIFVKLMYERDLYQEQKSKLIKQLFEDFREYIAITLYDTDITPATVYDAESLENAGLTIDDLALYRKDNPLPEAQIHENKIYIENSTFTDKLYTMTMVISYQDPYEKVPRIVEAVISLGNLLELTGRSEIFDTFLVDSRGNLLAHSDPEKLFPVTSVDWIPELEILLNPSSLGGTFEYEYKGKQVVGGFAPLDMGSLIIGVQIQKTAAYLSARELLDNLMIISFILLTIAALLGIFWSKRFTKPIEKLSNATKKVGKGEFDITVDGEETGDEIGELSNSFNQMASELNIREKALKDAHSALVHSEKMAAFGQLGAGIAHEVKNPLAGILGFAQLSLRKTDKDSNIYKNLSVIEKETKRCKNIIDNLMKFARQEKVSFMPVSVNSVVEDSIAIVDHQLSINKVKLGKKLEDNIPNIYGNGNQIQQVLINLMINAQQAMNGNPGNISLETALVDADKIEICIRDDGPGIPEEVQSKIFEPFFTTKAAGEGTGLGLSVSYGIIKDHGGEIEIDSETGKGTSFIITLPVKSSEEA